MFVVAVGLFGVVVGWGLALLAELVPDASGGGNHPLICRSCDQRLGPLSLLPLPMSASACTECGTRTPVGRLPVVVTTAVIFGLAASVVGARWQLVPVLVFAASLIALSAVDIARYRLPDRLTFPSLVASLLLITLLSSQGGEADHVLRAVVTALGYGTIMLIFNLISPASLAFGDVKLSLLLGLFLGWVADDAIGAARLVIWALLLGNILGILSGVLVGVGRRLFGNGFLPDPDFPPPEDGSVVPLLKTAFPFGPALAISAFSMVLWSESVLPGGILS